MLLRIAQSAWTTICISVSVCTYVHSVQLVFRLEPMNLLDCFMPYYSLCEKVWPIIGQLKSTLNVFCKSFLTIQYYGRWEISLLRSWGKYWFSRLRRNVIPIRIQIKIAQERCSCSQSISISKLYMYLCA